MNEIDSFFTEHQVMDFILISLNDRLNFIIFLNTCIYIRKILLHIQFNNCVDFGLNLVNLCDITSTL